jgi:transcription initiation factor IIE alpha subunit
LYYDIPPNGEINSHEFLVQQSGEYINFEANSEEIRALQDEIANLREELLNAQIQLASSISGIQITGSFT